MNERTTTAAALFQQLDPGVQDMILNIMRNLVQSGMTKKEIFGDEMEVSTNDK